MNQIRIGDRIMHLSTRIEGTVAGIVSGKNGAVLSVYYVNEKDMPEFCFYGDYQKVDRFITHKSNVTKI